MLINTKSAEKLGKTSLNSLMNLYQTNYFKINRLLGTFFPKQRTDKQIPNEILLRNSTDSVPIKITLIDSAKYTITIKMSYLFTDIDSEIPNAEIRIYHDTQQAEVLKMVNKERMLSFFSLTHYEGLDNIKARFQLNNFLYKWLQYCLENNYEPVC